MANRPKGFGYTREVEERMRAKYDPEYESETVEWIAARTGRTKPAPGQDALRDWLLDGSVLCELMKSFELPGIKCDHKQTCHIKLAPMKLAKENENIELFLKAAEKMGMKRGDMFQVVNIRDNLNMAQVLSTLYSLGTLANSKGISGPVMGTKYSEKNEREFTDEQKKAGKGVIGLQMGTNQLASQSGMTGYGQGRQIVHKTD